MKVFPRSLLRWNLSPLSENLGDNFISFLHHVPVKNVGSKDWKDLILEDVGSYLATYDRTLIEKHEKWDEVAAHVVGIACRQYFLSSVKSGKDHNTLPKALKNYVQPLSPVC